MTTLAAYVWPKTEYTKRTAYSKAKNFFVNFVTFCSNKTSALAENLDFLRSQSNDVRDFDI